MVKSAYEKGALIHKFDCKDAKRDSKVIRRLGVCYNENMNAFAAFVKHPLNVHFESQESGEEILYLLRRHFITNVGWIISSILMFIGPIVLMSLLLKYDIDTNSILPLRYQYIIVLIWYLITVVFVLESFLNWYFNVYIVTTKRIVDIDFWGLLYKNVSEADYEHIEDVTYSMGGVLQTIFNFGRVVIQTAAEQREFEFDGVPNPAEVYDKITDLVQASSAHRSKRKVKKRHDI